MALSPLSQQDIIDLIVIASYMVGILILWRLPYVKWILYPFKLVTIVFHEFGHASTAVCTGGHVVSIEVDPDLGGATELRGGVRCITLPAGYLGSSLIGAAMIFSGFDLLASKICSVIVMAALLVTLYWAKNWLLRGLTVLFVAFIGFLWWPGGGVGLPYVVLFMGYERRQTPWLWAGFDGRWSCFGPTAALLAHMRAHATWRPQSAES